ncbi:RraA family protein [Clostridium transplantifaecale]|uniref:RraA family protein n=1 Tax=Clostridium transplantifaecale TaxID=2479838 RepID=UPI000F636343|nr:RraA family protein [Clostridium transplantifaecale]
MINRAGLRILDCPRPDRELTEAFRGLPSSNIADNMGRLYNTNSSIRALNGLSLCGPAFTVKVPQGDNLMFHKALDLALPGDIIVVDGEGDMEHALAGELMIRHAIRRKLGGFVINGCMRDFDAIEALPFPVYAKGITPQGPYKSGPGEINVPVCCAGRVICPGDILVGDRDGIAIIPAEFAKDLLSRAKKKFEGEQKRIMEDEPGNRDWVDRAIEAAEKGVM